MEDKVAVWGRRLFYVGIVALIAWMAFLVSVEKAKAQTENSVRVIYDQGPSGQWLRAIEVEVTGCDILVRFENTTLLDTENPNGDCGYFELVDYSLEDEVLLADSSFDWYAQSEQSNGIPQIVVVEFVLYGSKIYIPLITR